jgi:hypothetical protein
MSSKRHQRVVFTTQTPPDHRKVKSFQAGVVNIVVCLAVGRGEWNGSINGFAGMAAC